MFAPRSGYRGGKSSLVSSDTLSTRFTYLILSLHFRLFQGSFTASHVSPYISSDYPRLLRAFTAFLLRFTNFPCCFPASHAFCLTFHGYSLPFPPFTAFPCLTQLTPFVCPAFPCFPCMYPVSQLDFSCVAFTCCIECIKPRCETRRGKMVTASGPSTRHCCNDRATSQITNRVATCGPFLSTTCFTSMPYYDHFNVP